MKRILLLLMVVFSTTIITAQKKTCDSPEDTLEDLSSIAKCTIESSKKSKSKRTRQISVKVSASKAKKRFLKKRVLKKEMATTSSNVSSSSVSNLNVKSEMGGTLSLKSNLANIADRLSAEEVRKADKFTTVDNIPTFEGCKNVKKGEQMDCFNDEMIKHIQEHFNYPNEAIIQKLEGNVWVRFIIDKDGSISNIKALGPKNAKVLDDEAKRVVSLLPKFVPATKKGKPVSVKYGFPISFYLGED